MRRAWFCLSIECLRDAFVRIQGLNAKLPSEQPQDLILLQLSAEEERSNPFERDFQFWGQQRLVARGVWLLTMPSNISLHIQTCLKGATNIHKAEEKSKIYSNPKQFRKSFLRRQQRLGREIEGKLKLF